MLDIIRGNDTPVAKAIALLQIESREYSQITQEEQDNNIFPTEFQFGYQGIYNYFLNYDMSSKIL